MKKYLLSLLVCVFWFIGFSNAWSVTFSNVSNNSNDYMFLTVPWVLLSSSYNVYMSMSDVVWCSDLWYFLVSSSSINNPIYWYAWWSFVRYPDWEINITQFWDTAVFLWIAIPWDCSFSSVTFSWDWIVDTFIWWSSSPEIDTWYCVENDLCPVPENYSNIFVNNIEFPSKPLVNVSIPDYITWDYTGTDSAFELYVGSGYDVDYINSIIDINSYRPNSEDFTNIFVSGLTLVFPYIIFVLFLVFMRKLIKRIFK